MIHTEIINDILKMNKIIFMNNSQVTPQKYVKTVRHQITPLTSDLSDSGSFRLRRTRERSHSKKSNASSSRESDAHSINSFYVKNIYSQKKVQNPKTQRKEQKQQRQYKQKTRSPTPCKSKNLLPTNSSQKNALNEQLRMIQIENKLQTTQLQKWISERDHIIQKQKNRINGYDQKLKEITKKLKQRQSQIEVLKKQKKDAQVKIDKLEKSILSNESSLNEANNNLQKLRKAIKDNRITDLKKANQNLTQKIDKLNKNYQILEDTLQEKNKRIGDLQKQNKSLLNRTILEKHCRNESMREKYLQKELEKLKQKNTSSHEQLMEDKIKQLSQDNFYLHGQIRKLNIKLNYIQRKNMDQFRTYTTAKNEEVSIQKKKYKKLLEAYQQKKKEIHKLRENSLKEKAHSTLNVCSNRKGLLQVENVHIRKLSLSFQLSPQ